MISRVSRGRVQTTRPFLQTPSRAIRTSSTQARSIMLLRQVICIRGMSSLTSRHKWSPVISAWASACRTTGCSVDRPRATDCTNKSTTSRSESECGNGNTLRTCWSASWISTTVRNAVIFMQSTSNIARVMRRLTLASGGVQSMRRMRAREL